MREQSSRLAAAAAAILAAFGMLAPASGVRAESVADFYKGRTINVVIGNSVGGGYDLNARLVAKYLGKYIPGEPTLVPQNMPGAGGLKSANYLYAVAPKDGTVIGILARSMALEPLFDETPSARYDGTKFAWLGSVSRDVSLCLSWQTSPIKTWNDAMTKPYTVAGQGAGSDPDVFALSLKNLLGAKIKLVTGFPGTNEMTLAMERGEVDGLCGLSYSTLKSRHGSWLAEKKVHLLLQAARAKDPELPNVPLIFEEAKNDEERQIMNLIVATQSMARPFAAPPGLPADRKAALRTAFDQTMKDPAFIAKSEKLHLDVTPMTGAEIDTLLAELYAIPQDIVKKAARVMAEP